MNELKDFLGRILTWPDSKCLECKVSEHSILVPGGLIYEDSLVSVYPELRVNMLSFIVVAPKRHVTSEDELTEEERNRITDVITNVSKLLIKHGLCDDTYIHQRGVGYHLKYWVIGAYSPYLEREFSLNAFETEDTMKRHGLPYTNAGKIMLMVQILKSDMKRWARKELSKKQTERDDREER